ncbi:MAG: hypothetical protein AB7U61_15660 [Methylocystis sp.]
MSKSDDEKLRRQIREAAPDAIAALHAICRDERAPAPARASAAGWIVRAAGLDKNPAASDDELETPSEAELKAYIAQLEAHGASLAAAKAAKASDAAEKPADARKGRREGKAAGLFD